MSFRSACRAVITNIPVLTSELFPRAPATGIGELSGFEEFMLSEVSDHVLAALCGLDCVHGELTRADLWLMHIVEDGCKKHGKRCTHAKTQALVRVLQPGEGDVSAETTRRLVASHIKAIAGDSARQLFSRDGASVNAKALARTPFRLRPATPPPPRGTPLSGLTPTLGAGGVVGETDGASSASTAAAAAVEAAPTVQYKPGSFVKVLRRAGPYVNPPREEAHAFVVHVDPGTGAVDVVYVDSHRRPESGIATVYLAEPDFKYTEGDRLAHQLVLHRRRIDRLVRAEAKGAARERQQQEELRRAQAEIARTQSDFNRLVRGGPDGMMTKLGRVYSAHMVDAAVPALEDLGCKDADASPEAAFVHTLRDQRPRRRSVGLQASRRLDVEHSYTPTSSHSPPTHLTALS